MSEGEPKVISVIDPRKLDKEKKINKEDMKGMKFKFVGIGAAGNKAVLQLLEDGVATQDQVLLINSTKKDIPDDYTGNFVILSPNNAGCGKERSIAKQYALDTMRSGALDAHLTDDETDSILIAASVEGGTGSGSAPIIGEYCNKVLGKNVHIVAFTGFEEDVRGLQNSIEFFQELNFDCDVQSIRNSAFLKSSSNNKFAAEQLANKEFVARTRVLLGMDMISSTQNIDDTDIFKIINTTGYKTIEKITFTEDLMDRSDFDKLCKSMIYNSKSLKSAKPGQLRLGVILNISPMSEDAVDSSYTIIKEAYGIPYECFTHRQWDGKEQYVAFISSGMKLPLDEVKAIHERYIAASSSVDKNDDSFFDEISKLGKKSEDSKFDMVRTGSNKKPINGAKNDFFKQFETKPEK